MYTYKDENDHEITMTVLLTSTDEIICGCGLAMYRKFYPAKVNWGGITPSQERSPVVQHMLDTKDTRREQYEKEQNE